MLKFPLDDAHPSSENRTVLVQPNQPVMIPHQAGDNPWAYLVGYDFADEGEDGTDWLPGHA
jgi:hypothetical protein